MQVLPVFKVTLAASSLTLCINPRVGFLQVLPWKMKYLTCNTVLVKTNKQNLVAWLHFSKEVCILGHNSTNFGSTEKRYPGTAAK